MGDTASVKWFNDGRWGTTSTLTPKFGVYRLLYISTPESREREKVFKINKNLKRFS